jgi:predicted dehydrogenase
MSKTRLAILGAGWWAVENHIPALMLRPDVEISGVCRLGREELRRVQEQFGIQYGTEDYEELLRHQKPDGVIISSPHHLHYKQALAALEQGIHVLCEKPMALHTSEAKHLELVVQSRNLHFLIPYGWNYTGFAQKARGLVQKGEVGTVEHVLCHMASALRDLFDGQGAWFAEQAFFKPAASTWSDPSLGGGFAHGQLSHALALLLWMTDLQPAEVFAFMRSSRSGADIHSAMSCRFKNGVTCMVGGAATMPPGSPYQVDIRIFGSGGMLLLDIERPRLEIYRNDGRHYSIDTLHRSGAYSCVEPVHTFVDLLQGKPVENRSSASLGVKVVDVLDAAFRSARSGRVETIDTPVYHPPPFFVAEH